MTTVAVDVIIPTVRLDPAFLLPLLSLSHPEKVSLHYYVVVDNPGLEIPYTLERRVAKEDVTVLFNDTNIGAAMSRNRGLDEGKGDYVLFLDDDVIACSLLIESYYQAILRYPEAPGFVGSTRFPKPINSFTRGVILSDILTFFPLAETREEMLWGVTANLLLKREAIGGMRFSEHFPKGGGGEDIDLGLRIIERAGSLFRTVPRAVVDHPWWFDGKRKYTRFSRWAYGDSRLPSSYPEFKYRNAPNLPETLLLGGAIIAVVLLLGLVTPMQFGLWLLAIVTAEFVADAVKLHIRGNRTSILTSIEATLVRLSNDIGRIRGNLRRGHITGFTERFDYFGTGESIGYERRVAIGKFAVFVILSLLVLAPW